MDEDEKKDKRSNRSKLEVAKYALFAILEQLGENDFFGLLTFESHTEIIQPLEKMSKIDLKKLKAKIKNIHTRGGTELGDAIKTATEMFSKVRERERERKKERKKERKRKRERKRKKERERERERDLFFWKQERERFLNTQQKKKKKNIVGS